MFKKLIKPLSRLAMDAGEAVIHCEDAERDITRSDVAYDSLLVVYNRMVDLMDILEASLDTLESQEFADSMLVGGAKAESTATETLIGI